MDHTVHNKLISFIWNIADDCLRDVYVRGKYRDVILPMVVLRRLDTLLEPSKEAVLAEVQFQQQELKMTEFDDEPLRFASGYVFYNTSQWTLTSLLHTASNNQKILLSNFTEYLLGFSQNVQEIIKCFNLSAQIEHMIKKQVLYEVVERFVSKDINFTHQPIADSNGLMLPALTNLGMGYVFEELIRKFNEENNEEAGEHFTPREVIELMTHLVFDPIKSQLPPIMTVYDPACGSGGMLTEAQNFIHAKYPQDNRDIYLYGQEINDETYAICKSDMMIKGNNPEHIKLGSTLSSDSFAAERFDFMLSNPPYGKSWASEQKHIKASKEVIDARFKVQLADCWGKLETLEATPRSSDGQLLFLMEMVSKMKDPQISPLGSRIASVHNGSSLFTGDAGGGESNIRRYLIENDMLEAIVQLPNNLFYNTGITTYIWLLNNKKAADRQGKVQLIDASLLFQKLRKNLGNKNCAFSPQHIVEITQTYLDCAEVSRQQDATAAEGQRAPVGIASKVFHNEDFGYYKVAIERPDRRKAQFSQAAIASLRFDKQLSEAMTYLYDQYGERLYLSSGFGGDQQQSFLQSIEQEILAWCAANAISLNGKAKNKLLDVSHWQALQNVQQQAQQLMAAIGTAEFDDFNQFKTLVEQSLKSQNIKLAAAEKNAILNAVSWYDASAQKVVQKVVKLSDDKLAALLQRYGCTVAELPDFGYTPGDRAGEWILYESQSDLRDSESVPLRVQGTEGAEQAGAEKEAASTAAPARIHQYFVHQVKPHVAEAWINLDTVKIGYEISFNKYFYQHQPLRSLETVANEILQLEQQAEGLIAQILGMDSKKAKQTAMAGEA